MARFDISKDIVRKGKESWGDQNQILICRYRAGTDCKTIYAMYKKGQAQFAVWAWKTYKLTNHRPCTSYRDILRADPRRY